MLNTILSLSIKENTYSLNWYRCSIRQLHRLCHQWQVQWPSWWERVTTLGGWGSVWSPGNIRKSCCSKFYGISAWANLRHTLVLELSQLLNLKINVLCAQRVLSFNYVSPLLFPRTEGDEMYVCMWANLLFSINQKHLPAPQLPKFSTKLCAFFSRFFLWQTQVTVTFWVHEVTSRRLSQAEMTLKRTCLQHISCKFLPFFVKSSQNLPLEDST